MSKASRNFWIELGVLLLLLAAVIAAFAISASEPLSRDDLRIQAGALRSFAASGRLLAIQFSRGETTETFFHNQTELIQNKASDAEKSLSGAKTLPDLREDLDRIAKLCHDLTAALNDLQNGPDSAASAAKLDALTHQINNEEDKLK